MVKKKYFYAVVVMNVFLVCLMIYLFRQQPLEASSVPTTETFIVIQETTSQTTQETTVKAPEPTPTLEPTIPSQTTTETSQEPRYGFTDKEVYLLAQLLCGEEKISGDGEYDFVWRGKCIDSYFKEMSKVLCVVMNRQRSSKFPNTVKGVITQKGQFSVIPNNLDSKPSLVAINAVKKWCEAYDNYDESVQTIPEDHLFFCAGPNNTNVTRKSWK